MFAPSNTLNVTMPELEDEVADIIGKAARGNKQWMAKGNCINLLDEGQRCGLNRQALKQIQAGNYPLPQLTLPGVHQLILPFEQWTVNAWLIQSPSGALLIDCGFEPSAKTLLEQINKIIGKQHPLGVLLTHDDRDHWGAATSLKSHYPQARFLGPSKESPKEFEEIAPQKSISLQDFTLSTIPLPGHTPHGIGWKIEHPSFKTPLIACGDALFAGSLGKIRGDYQEGLSTIRKNLLSLPEPWALLPGHGPITSIGTEKYNNPFFAS